MLQCSYCTVARVEYTYVDCPHHHIRTPSVSVLIQFVLYTVGPLTLKLLIPIRHTCGILGSLATIYRQREGTYYKHCEEVLHMEEKVLKKFKQSIEGTNDKGKIQCYDGLEYRYHMLRFNVCIKNKRLNDAVPFFRKLLEYEVRNNLDYEHQQFLFLLDLIHLQPTPATVYNLTKTQVLKLLNRLINHWKVQHKKVLCNNKWSEEWLKWFSI